MRPGCSYLSAQTLVRIKED